MDLLTITGIIGGIWLLVRLARGPRKGSGSHLDLHTPPPARIKLSGVTPRQTDGQVRPRSAASQETSSPVSAVVSPKTVRTPTRWLSQGEEIEIQGVRISGGLLYVGSSLSTASGYGIEPALVDPRLPIQALGAEEDMPYWPSYSDISPSSRGAYLRWLAAGRCDPAANIGLIFLFFYGLERRVIAERSQVSDAEWEQIRAEVERLLGVYGHNQSFRGYATAFLGVLGATTIDGDSLADHPPAVTKSYESPNLALRMGLGWMAKNSRPIPSNWALAWVRSHDTFHERTPAARCRDQFEGLFALRYREQFGEGFIVKPNRTPLKASYKTASASFSGEVNLTIPELPDITVLKQPIEKLILLANQCTDELDPYSRYLGRNPNSGENAAALALLPAALVQQSGHPALERITGWIKSLSFTNGLAVASYKDLRSVWSSLPAADVGKRDAVTLSQCLALLGYGMEPDIRFGCHQVEAEEQIVLFALPSDSPAAPSAQYTSSTLLSHLGAVMAHADNQVTLEEERALMSHSTHALELTEPERLRLQAYTKWLLLAPAETIGLKKRIESLPKTHRAMLGSFLARLVGLDGQIAPAEIKALEKVYRQLGLDPKCVFADTHSAVTEPITMQRGEPAPGYAIPKPKSSPTRSKVNLDRVRAMEMESEQVSILLREIFTADEGGVTKAAAHVEGAVLVTVRVLDLDGAHSSFVLSLIERDLWIRAELDAVAAQHSLMPEGAIDAINEAALNLHGEPLLEGDDPVEVNQQLRSVITP